MDDLAAQDPDVAAAQMMGRPSIKAGGKLIACLESRGTMAFKLPDEAEQEKALALEGARVYEPADNGRKMGGWIEVPRRRTKTGGRSSRRSPCGCEGAPSRASPADDLAHVGRKLERPFERGSVVDRLAVGDDHVLEREVEQLPEGGKHALFVPGRAPDHELAVPLRQRVGEDDRALLG